MNRRVRISAENGVLALTAALAGVAGVVGSYAAVGFTQAFVASPIEGFLTRMMPDIVVRYAITVLGHLGQRLNLVFALGLGVVLLGVLSGLAIVAGRRADSALASVALAGVSCALAVALLVGTSVSAIGAGIGAAIVVGVAALASTTTVGGQSVSGERRRALGSIASAFGIAIGGYLIGHDQVENSAGGDEGEGLQSLEGVNGGADGNTSTDERTSEIDDPATDTAADSTSEPGQDEATTEVNPGTPTSQPVEQGTANADETDETATAVGETEADDGGTETAVSEDGAAGGETATGETDSGETDSGESDSGQTDSGESETTTSVEPTIDAMLAAAEQRSLGVANLDGLLSDGFYEVDISNVNPNVASDGWTLSITGAVDSERTFSYDDLTSIPAENRFVSLRCVSDSLNGDKMDTALWTGVPVMTLLEESGLPDECCVRLRAADDYQQVFPLEALRNGFLAYGMNGDLLPRGHGAPVRALIPGHWGEINVKWLTEIEVLKQDAEGYWEKKGWHGTGPVNTVAKFHATNRSDGQIQVGGHAYAGTRGIQEVEVSTDGGESWNAATLSERLPPGTSERENGSDHAEDAWRQWEYTYDTPGNSHKVIVRATDGEGDLQPEDKQDSYPSGATGWVSKTIDG